MYEQILKDTRREVDSHPDWTDDVAACCVIRAVLDAYFTAKLGTRRDLLVEKTPAHVFYGREILTAFPEARLLHVLRDGRDVCVSLQMRSLAVNWAPRDRRAQIKLWKRHVEKGRELVSDPEYAGRTMQIRYEDIKRDPVSAIAQLYDFAGLECADGFAQQVAEQTDFTRHGKTGDGMHNRKGIVGDWKNHFTPEDNRLFRRLAGELLERCGYYWEDEAQAA
jgi:hypothetical protein